MKKLLSILIVFALSMTMLVGCTSTSTDGKKGQTSADDAIKIGVLCTQDSASGLGAVAAVELYFQQHGLEMSGRKVEVFYENTSSDAAVCIEKLVKCVDEYGCQFIIGPLSGSEGTAVKEYAENYLEDVTIIVGSSGSTQITLNTPANLFRVCATGAQAGMILGKYAYEELGYRNILTLASDYDFTFGQVAGFLYGFVAAGGNVVDRIWFTKGATDYSSALASISKYKDVDAIFCGVGASDSMYFVQQYVEYGLKYPLLGGSNFTDVSCLVSDISSYYDGIITSSYYADDLNTPEYTSFVDSFTKYYGSAPSSFACDFYMACEVISSAIDAVEGKIEDVTALRAAIAKTNYQSPRGILKFDEDHQSFCDIFVCKVTKNEAGAYRNSVIKTYNNVSQYGDFDKAWYATQPDPDRDNPTIEDIKNAVYKK